MLDESDHRMRGGFDGVGSPGRRWTGIANWQEVKPLEEGRAQTFGAVARCS